MYWSPRDRRDAASFTQPLAPRHSPRRAGALSTFFPAIMFGTNLKRVGLTPRSLISIPCLLLGLCMLCSFVPAVSASPTLQTALPLDVIAAVAAVGYLALRCWARVKVR